ncbi:uncharacterized protein LOC129719516 [Wyeomyia smithii]|uniref:uncharacterized protein LOC129719516 n=1 Tax=Wyeomyia smithii TaxID=174621 RepID=UPI002467B4A2|nr:uncharacterized protein LOC129719516 [Wyeomyia smithii]
MCSGFTCMAVRVVHLDVVYSLSTQSCLMAIRRFSSKRGTPDHIFSDNATCFHGANTVMTKEIKKIHKECAERVTSSITAWHFNPPGTPHMGGVWERMVRSVKEALRVLDDGRRLTDEILFTALAEAEDLFNTHIFHRSPPMKKLQRNTKPFHPWNSGQEKRSFGQPGSIL